MAKLNAIWVIVTGASPTEFRSRERADLLPTLKQLQSKQPNTRLVWFEANRFWDSPEEAAAAFEAKRQRRGSGWRPGGKHEDPRAKYKVTRDQKRARFKANLIRGRKPDADPPADGGSTRRNPFGPPADDRADRAGDTRKPADGSRPRTEWRKPSDRPKTGGGWRKPDGEGRSGSGPGDDRKRRSGPGGDKGSGRGPGGRGPGSRGPGGRGPGSRGPGGRGPGSGSGSGGPGGGFKRPGGRTGPRGSGPKSGGGKK